MMTIIFHPLENLCRSLDRCQTRSLPFWLKLQDKQIDHFHRGLGGIFHSAVCTVPWDGSQLRNVLPIVKVLEDQRMQVPLATRAK